MLCHPGETRTEHTLRQQFYWRGLRTTVHDVCKKCPTCQREKTTNQKYGKLPPKQAETNPWDTLCADLICPYTMPRKGKNPLKLWCLTMIYPATGWFEMSQIPNETAAEIADITEKLGLLVTHSHNELCLIAVPNSCLNLQKCVTMTMA